MTEFSHERYLRAKRTVDDRAIDRRTFDRLRGALSGRESLSIVEIGCGIGTGFTRLVDWGLFPAGSVVEYVGVDRRPGTVARAHRHVTSWAEGAGHEVRTDEDRQVVGTDERSFSVRFLADDARSVLDEATDVDLLVGQAIFDLLDLERALSACRSALRSGGLLYAPITFDGLTAFEPAHPLDERLLKRYHASMDERTGHSETGRRLLTALPTSGMELLAAGGSDWIVFPPYSADEAYFLAHLTEFVRRELVDADPNPEVERWVETRRSQIEREELVLVAHNLDVLGRVR
ncbi:class I SAM-dependent methyltransferase [Natronorarus salvus]|uniref:class I SAM-dependent methyltransferase n=1 Tax=Natronorarus salvus TaxID=3117733 RepID=UPI002F266E83